MRHCRRGLVTWLLDKRANLEMYGSRSGSPMRETITRAVAWLITHEDWDPLKMQYLGRFE